MSEDALVLVGNDKGGSVSTLRVSDDALEVVATTEVGGDHADRENRAEIGVPGRHKHRFVEHLVVKNKPQTRQRKRGQ